jgi:tryptophanyl-tRNA synthetase
VRLAGGQSSIRDPPDHDGAERSSEPSASQQPAAGLTGAGPPTTTADSMSAQVTAKRETIFSGIQPSGELHLGNYLGAIRNWVALQDSYRCFYCIVDYHAITQPFEPAEMQKRVREMAADLIACGIDPERSTLFVQSAVREHTELAWVLASVTGFGELGRMTQFKDKAERNPDNINAGLFTYPVLQAADILIYRATKVPVGEDQRQHLELAREIVRKWNARFGDTFPEPEALYSSTPKILGLDGQAKMSKSLGNTISLREEDAPVWEKLRTAATDPARVRRTDPGDPDKCNVFTLHKFFSSDDRQAEVRQGCSSAGIGCIECKKWLLEGVKADLESIRARRAKLLAAPDAIDTILAEGARRARQVAQATMTEVRERLGIETTKA